MDARDYAKVNLDKELFSDVEFLAYDGQISDALVDHVVDDLCYRLAVFDMNQVS